MTYKPTYNFMIDIDCESGSSGSYPLGVSSWYEIVGQPMMIHSLWNSSNAPYEKITNNIPNNISFRNNSLALKPGLYEILVEYDAKWNNTHTATINTLKGGNLYRRNGNRSWSEVVPPSIIVTDTGHTISSGYNLLNFKARHYIRIDNNGTEDNTYSYGYGSVLSTLSGFNHGSIPLYKRRLTVNLVTGYTF